MIRRKWTTLRGWPAQGVRIGVMTARYLDGLRDMAVGTNEVVDF